MMEQTRQKLAMSTPRTCAELNSKVNKEYSQCTHNSDLHTILLCWHQISDLTVSMSPPVILPSIISWDPHLIQRHKEAEQDINLLTYPPSSGLQWTWLWVGNYKKSGQHITHAFWIYPTQEPVLSTWQTQPEYWRSDKLTCTRTTYQNARPYVENITTRILPVPTAMTKPFLTPILRADSSSLVYLQECGGKMVNEFMHAQLCTVLSSHCIGCHSLNASGWEATEGRVRMDGPNGT